MTVPTVLSHQVETASSFWLPRMDDPGLTGQDGQRRGDGRGLGLGVGVGGALGEIGELDGSDPLGAETAPGAHALTESRTGARATADLTDPRSLTVLATADTSRGGIETWITRKTSAVVLLLKSGWLWKSLTIPPTSRTRPSVRPTASGWKLVGGRTSRVVPSAGSYSPAQVKLGSAFPTTCGPCHPPVSRTRPVGRRVADDTGCGTGWPAVKVPVTGS